MAQLQLPSQPLPLIDGSEVSRFCQTPTHQLIDRISSKLRNRLPIELNHDTQQRPSSSTDHSRFQALISPTITIQAYLTRLITLAPISVDAILLALLYINRTTTTPLIPSQSLTHLRPRDPSLPTVPYHLYTVHRLLLSGLIVANKFISDHYLSASRASKVGGIPLDDLAGLERGLLRSLGFSLNFTIPELDLVARWVLLEEDQSLDLETDQLTIKFSTQSVSGPETDSTQGSSSSVVEHRTTQAPIDSLDPPSSSSQPDPLPSSTSDQPSSSTSDLLPSSTPDLLLHPPSEDTTPTPDPEPRPPPTRPLTNPPPPKRRGRVFLRTNFICDPRYNTNYQSRRPSYGGHDELESQTRIVVTKLDSKALKIKTEIIGYHLLTGEKVCKMLSSQSFEVGQGRQHRHPSPSPGI